MLNNFQDSADIADDKKTEHFSNLPNLFMIVFSQTQSILFAVQSHLNLQATSQFYSVSVCSRRAMAFGYGRHCLYALALKITNICKLLGIFTRTRQAKQIVSQIQIIIPPLVPPYPKISWQYRYFFLVPLRCHQSHGLLDKPQSMDDDFPIKTRIERGQPGDEKSTCWL